MWRHALGTRGILFALLAFGVPAIEMGIDDGYGFSALGGAEPFFPDFTAAVGFEL